MRADAAMRRQLIVDTAIEIFQTTHPDDVPLDAIAKQAGVGVATLYRNFADRRQLMLACGVAMLTRVRERFELTLQQFDDARSTNPEHAWQAIGPAWKDTVCMLVDAGIGTLVPVMGTEARPHLGDEARTELDKVHSLGAKVVSQVIEAGYLPSDSTFPSVAAALVIITRPPVPSVARLGPHITERLVMLFLAGAPGAPVLPEGLKTQP